MQLHSLAGDFYKCLIRRICFKGRCSESRQTPQSRARWLNKPDPYCESFQRPSKRECSRNQSGKPFRSACNQHSLQCEGKTQFGQRGSHPKAPFLKHQWGKRGRTGCSQYRYRKSLLNETCSINSKIMIAILPIVSDWPRSCPSCQPRARVLQPNSSLSRGHERSDSYGDKNLWNVIFFEGFTQMVSSKCLIERAQGGHAFL